MSDITIELLEQLEREMSAIRDRCDEIFNDYANAYYLWKSGYGMPQDSGSIDSISLEDGDVVCRWSDSWSYGGYDSGTVYIPYGYILDDDLLQDYIKRRRVTYNTAIEAEKKADRETKKKQLERLKEELGEE
jgi:hypothetical protein